MNKKTYSEKILDAIRNYCLGKDVQLPPDEVIEDLYNNDLEFRKSYDKDEVIQAALNCWLEGSKKRKTPPA